MKLTYIGVEEIRGVRQLTWEFEYLTREEIPYTKWFKSKQEGETFMQLFLSQLREIQAQKRLEAKACAESMAQHMTVIIERRVLEEEIQENEQRLRQLEYQSRECTASMAQHMAVVIERRILQEEIQENERRLRQLDQYC